MTTDSQQAEREAAQCPATLDGMRCESYTGHPRHAHFTEGSLEMLRADVATAHAAGRAELIERLMFEHSHNGIDATIRYIRSL